MRLISASIVAFSLFGAIAAQAQTTPTQGVASPGSVSQSFTGRTGTTAREEPPHVFFTFGDINGVVNAPVAAPDSGIAYQTFEGQPMQSRDAVLAGHAGLTGK
ncbi:MAG TPA: hypothetical protein VGH36_14745 [Acetobacteraceae bacterium]|jgi:hypothetical protein